MLIVNINLQVHIYTDNAKIYKIIDYSYNVIHNNIFIGLDKTSIKYITDKAF